MFTAKGWPKMHHHPWVESQNCKWLVGHLGPWRSCQLMARAFNKHTNHHFEFGLCQQNIKLKKMVEYDLSRQNSWCFPMCFWRDSLRCAMRWNALRDLVLTTAWEGGRRAGNRTQIVWLLGVQLLALSWATVLSVVEITNDFPCEKPSFSSPVTSKLSSCHTQALAARVRFPVGAPLPAVGAGLACSVLRIVAVVKMHGSLQLFVERMKSRNKRRDD